MASMSYIRVSQQGGSYKNDVASGTDSHGFDGHPDVPWHPELSHFDPATSFCEEDMELLAEWGQNVVRLGIMWPGVSFHVHGQGSAAHTPISLTDLWHDHNRWSLSDEGTTTRTFVSWWMLLSERGSTGSTLYWTSIRYACLQIACVAYVVNGRRGLGCHMTLIWIHLNT
jgi:hypothetical protein